MNSGDNSLTNNEECSCQMCRFTETSHILYNDSSSTNNLTYLSSTIPAHQRRIPNFYIPQLFSSLTLARIQPGKYDNLRDIGLFSPFCNVVCIGSHSPLSCAKAPLSTSSTIPFTIAETIPSEAAGEESIYVRIHVHRS